jgi:acyl-CoA synthetase (AMP-forming)/AMP-acid ligase II
MAKRFWPIGTAALVAWSAPFAGPGFLSFWTANAVCSDETVHTIVAAHFKTPVVQDGASTEYEVAPLTVVSRPGAHVLQAIWFKTNGSSIDGHPPDLEFIEFGVFEGWWNNAQQSLPAFFYSNRTYMKTDVLPGGGTNTYPHEVDYKFDRLPVAGHDITFDVKQVATNDVKVQLVDNDTSGLSYHVWQNHSPGPYWDWQVGQEWTCTNGSIGGTYVHNNEYRRNSDHVWVSASSDGPVYWPPAGREEGWGTSVTKYGKWCVTGRTFVYWYNEPDPGCP